MNSGVNVGRGYIKNKFYTLNFVWNAWFYWLLPDKYPWNPYFYGMKHIGYLVFALFIALSAPACSKKSGCPSDSAQTKVDKHGQYKSGKTNSGLLPAKKNYKKKKGPYTPKHKEKHKN